MRSTKVMTGSLVSNDDSREIGGWLEFQKLFPASSFALTCFVLHLFVSVWRVNIRRQSLILSSPKFFLYSFSFFFFLLLFLLFFLYFITYSFIPFFLSFSSHFYIIKETLRQGILRKLLFCLYSLNNEYKKYNLKTAYERS